ncbi:hypothetical protein ABZP36_023207 [Zizania latifolia]
MVGEKAGSKPVGGICGGRDDDDDAMHRRREKDGSADQLWDEAGQQIGVGGDRQRVGLASESAGRRRGEGSAAAAAFGRTKAQVMPILADICGPGDGIFA